MNSVRNDQSGNTNNFWTNLSSVNPRMAVFLKLTPALSTGLTTIGLTSNTRDMTLAGHSGITFKSAPGFMPSSFEQAMDDPTMLEMTGIFDAVTFKRDDVLAGKWENASIEIFVRSWDDTAISYGELLVFKGFLGEIVDYPTFFKAEGRGLLSKLSQDAVTVTSRACRVKSFRNAQCGHTASTFVLNSVTYNITTATNAPSGSSSTKQTIHLSSANFPNAGSVPAGLYNNGLMTCTTGVNAGLSREILTNNATSSGAIIFKLKRPFPFTPESADRYTVTVGCNRTVEDCKKYSNIINFRGEPYVPGLTAVSKVPSANES